jgi:hypothetical protein
MPTHEGQGRRADKIEAVITDEAVVMLSDKLSTPLQFETYLTQSFEEGYRVAQKPVTVDVITSILAKDINDLEPRLTRQGYNAKVLAEVLNAKPREIRALLRGQLTPGRAQELQHEMLAVGIPLRRAALFAHNVSTFSPNVSRTGVVVRRQCEQETPMFSSWAVLCSQAAAVIEQWNGANDFVFFARRGELASIGVRITRSAYWHCSCCKTAWST